MNLTMRFNFPRRASSRMPSSPQRAPRCLPARNRADVKPVMARVGFVRADEKDVPSGAIAKYNSIMENLVPEIDFHFPPQLWAHAMIWAVFESADMYTPVAQISAEDLSLGLSSSFFSTKDKKGKAVFGTVEGKRASAYRRLVLQKKL